MASDLEAELAWQLRVLAVPPFLQQYRFHATRRWALDFAWPEKLVACEVDGGTWTHGRHARGAGIHADCEKYCEAALAGWRIIRVDAQMVHDGVAAQYVERFFVTHT